MFLLNSRLDHFSAPSVASRGPFSRSYGSNLPSSLTVNHSSALIFSIRPPVSVCGTGAPRICLADFLGSLLTPVVGSPEGSPYCQVRLGRRICLPPSAPTPFNPVFRNRAGLSLLRPHVAPRASAGMLTGSSIGLAVRLSLRPRLTLIRLALIRNPWSFGGRVFHPPYRYLYLHLLFHALQYGSRRAFAAHGVLPYRPSLVPRLRQHAYTRLLSTPNRSTSELLRTL